MVDMLLPAMAMDMPLPGPLMVIMLLPVMDMDMPLPGLLMVDMFLPAMNMTCPRWIRPLPEPSMTDTLSCPCQLWICFDQGLDFLWEIAAEEDDLQKAPLRRFSM